MLTKEDKEQARDMYERGYAVEEIAELLDLDECDLLDYVEELEEL